MARFCTHLKIELMGFTDRLDGRRERDSHSGNFKVFDHKKWLDRHAVIKCKDYVRHYWWGRGGWKKVLTPVLFC